MPLRPSPEPRTRSSSHGKTELHWDQSGGLNCPLAPSVNVPLCGKIYELIHNEESQNASAGRAVFCDSDKVAVAALWNAEIHQSAYPKWQDEPNSVHAERLGKIGHTFREWLDQLHRYREVNANMIVWRLSEILNRVVMCAQRGGDVRENLWIGGLDRLPGAYGPFDWW